MEVTKEMFHQWRYQNPVTLDFFDMLKERVEKINTLLGEGKWINNEFDGAKFVGRNDEIKELIELTYEQLRGIDADRTQSEDAD